MSEQTPEQPCVFLSLPHYGEFSAPTVAAIITASTRSHPLVQFECASLLAHCFNRLWAECLNLRAGGGERKPTHYAMLHADIGPDPGWLDVLLDEMERTGADVISAVSPIKDTRGLTSTGIQDPATGCIRRFTMHEIHSFPETFDSEAAGYGGKPLMVNTGCWVARLDRPWVADFPGFTIIDGLKKVGDRTVPIVLSEDWVASRWWADNGVKVFATRKVAISHMGRTGFRTDSAWGDWKIDKGDGLIVPNGEIEGWMGNEELAWLKERAAVAQDVVEVGSWHGRSTKAIAEACPGTVTAVDHFQGSPQDAIFVIADAASNGAGAEAREAFKRNLAAELEAGKVRLLEMPSVEAAAHLRNGGGPFAADMVFIDGAHDYESVKADILAWLPFLRPGALLCGHDRDDVRVKQAIDEMLPGWKSGAGTIWEYAIAGG